ncbi:hypothetical protein SAMD00020551_3043 [Mesobacillus selenatarsenatis SF-1]|uniref:Uncharacterized protein n=1 Tax=Mesobacillus selenatarsenatis (strain DSM 18680 / JCM 14380 / FERM P-15431 / SF-1) TaxID=1321606 RepID=A0A0A8X6N1_MESS1|nr:hypothetical protein SAMD00020551_3043 [Mesobacillus selenatarsenatis SF-1]
MREKPVNADIHIMIVPNFRWNISIVVDAAKAKIVCLLGKDESILDGMRIPTRLFSKGRGLS